MNKGAQSINYGMFIMPFHPPSKPLAQCYDEDLELIVRAEDLGFSEFWIGEHHTMKYENIVMPEMFIARHLARRGRFGWARRRSVFSNIIQRTLPGGWRSLTICQKGGSTCASDPAV